MRTDWNQLEKPLQAAMDAATSSGEEDKCQLAIYQNGKLVLSLYSGNGIDNKSLFPVFSCSKSVTATLAAILVQEGILSYDMHVCDVWPEFACNGKEEMRLWHFLSHRAGLYEIPEKITNEQMADWNFMCRLLAAATPKVPEQTALLTKVGINDTANQCNSPIGGAQIYHALTYAWLVGEVIQRATGRHFTELLKEKILKPLGIETDIVYGSNDELDKRFVPVDNSLFKTADWCSAFINTPVIRHACIPSASGLMCAEALARHYAALIGEVDGVRLLSPEILEKATTLCRSKDDPIEPITRWDKFGMGYALMGPPAEWGALFGQGGACGAEGMAFKHQGIAMAFTKNKSLPEHPIHKIRDTISDILDIPHRIW